MVEIIVFPYCMNENIYLTGGAFGMIYQMGAIKCLRKYVNLNKINFYGCSAGALTAVIIFLYTDEEILHFYKDITLRALQKIQNNPLVLDSYCLTPRHFETIDIINKHHPNAYQLLSGKINIGVTRNDKFVWFNTFSSNQDLFHKLLCSFHVPILCSYTATINGTKCIDGGFGMNPTKHLPKDTLTICPKYCEYAQLNGSIPVINCVIPPSNEIIEHYYKKGYMDMRKYLKKGKITERIQQPVLDETIIPQSVWHFLRNFQYEDKNYNVSIFG